MIVGRFIFIFNYRSLAATRHKQGREPKQLIHPLHAYNAICISLLSTRILHIVMFANVETPVSHLTTEVQSSS